MSSRSSTSKSSALAVIALLLLWVGMASTAEAGRKRICVLDFVGPNADKFHDDLVKLLKKSHTVVSVDKWNAAAEEADAGKVTEKNVKKLSKKLKLDGVITGKIEKRRDEYIIRLKLRSGSTGEIMGNSIQTKADGPRLDSQAQRDIKDELVGAIDELESNSSGGGDEETSGDDSGSHKSGFSRKHDMDEESSSKKDDEAKKDEEKKTKKDDEKKKKDDEKRKKDDEEKVAQADEAKQDEEKKDEDEARKKKKDSERKKKKVAEGDGETEGGGEEGVTDEGEVASVDKELAVSPARRAIDAVVGLSFTARQLNFKYSSDLGKPPPGYKQSIPVAGALVDMTFYPMSFNHQPKGIVSGLGLNILYDQVLKINSQKHYANAMGVQQTADLATKESRWEVGAVLRYPLGTSAKSIVVGGELSYGNQKFTVAQKLPNGEATDIPNVSYSILSPSVFIQAPVIPKVILNADVAFLAITNTGDIQQPTQYGAASVSGFEFNVGADYMLMTNVFIRAGIRYETIGFTFKGDPMSMTHTRDGDPQQDVQGARDTYFGGAATVGYLY